MAQAEQTGDVVDWHFRSSIRVKHARAMHASYLSAISSQLDPLGNKVRLSIKLWARTLRAD